MGASIGQIFGVLVLGWFAFFMFGWSAKDILGKPKAKRFKLKARRKYRIVPYNFNSRV